MLSIYSGQTHTMFPIYLFARFQCVKKGYIYIYTSYVIPATLCTVKYEPLQSIESSTGKKIFSRPQNKTENQTNEYDYEEISFFVFFFTNAYVHRCDEIIRVCIHLRWIGWNLSTKCKNLEKNHHTIDDVR